MAKKSRRLSSQRAKVQRQQATYKYYRRMGYSSKEASAMKGRTKQVWIDFYYDKREHKNFIRGLPADKRPPPPEAPRIIKTPTKKKIETNQFIKQGISDELAKLWGGLPQDEADMLKYKMSQFFRAIQERSDDPKETLKQFRALVKKIKEDPDFWRAFQDFYMQEVGVVLNQH